MQKTQYIFLATLLITVFSLMGALTPSIAHATNKAVPVIDLTLENHIFTPKDIKMPAGKPFIIRLKNADKTPAEFESHDMKAEKIVGGGKTISIRIRALKPGTYKFFDEFHEKTTRGTLTAQ